MRMFLASQAGIGLILELPNLEIICVMRKWAILILLRTRDTLEVCRHGQEVIHPTVEFEYNFVLYLQEDSSTFIYCQHNISVCISKQPQGVTAASFNKSNAVAEYY